MSTDFLGGKPTTWIKPTERNGGVPVNLQDQTTQPLDAPFAAALSNFTLSADTGESGLDVGSFVYTFTATGGHGIVITNQILLLDVAADRSFIATVINVAVNLITVDRPIDHDFVVATTLGRIVTTNMNVDGSVTPVIYSLRAGTIPTDVTRLIISLTDTTAMDSAKFGGQPALTNGLVFRIYNGFQKTVFNFKTNGSIRGFAYDGQYDDKAGSGLHGFFARISFGGQEKHGVVLRIADTDVLQWVVQDDLTALTDVAVTAQGHLTD